MTEDGVILDGTNRLCIAQELGIKIPCAIVSAEIVEIEPSQLENES
jgi:ParB-like chromosome segregation protein Spo0J